MRRRLRPRHQSRVYEEGAELVAEEHFDPEFGARPLRRILQRRVDNELSWMVLRGSLSPGDKAARPKKAGLPSRSSKGQRVTVVGEDE
jgi:ATP-dependent Clp protease ATP-binding subunit ClpC